MYLLPNGEICKDELIKSKVIDGYLLCLFKQGAGYRVSQINNESNIEMSMKFTESLDTANSMFYRLVYCLEIVTQNIFVDEKLAKRWPLFMHKKSRQLINAIEIKSVNILADDHYQIIGKQDKETILIHRSVFDYSQYGSDKIYLPKPNDFITYNDGRVLGCDRKQFLSGVKKIIS